YLRRLSNRLQPDDPGCDVPWMAMDDSDLARTMLLFTFVFLPVFAAVVVTNRAVPQAMPDGVTWKIVKGLNGYELGQLIFIFFGFYASGILSILCWKYRPKFSNGCGSESTEQIDFGDG